MTPATPWHQVSCGPGHMSAVRSEGALVAEEYLEHMRWNGSTLGFTYNDKWHRSTKNLCWQARNSMILCNHFSDVSWNQDEALGDAAHLLFATLRNGSTHAQREYIHREVGRKLDSPIIWRLSPVGWMESGMVLSFSEEPHALSQPSSPHERGRYRRKPELQNRN